MNESAETLRVRAFHVAHGPECYGDDGWVYYANGAKREPSVYGALVDPPDAYTVEGEYLLAQNKLMFAKLKLQAAVDEFDDLNDRLAVTNPNDPNGQLAKLIELQKAVDQRKELVAQAEEALANTRRGKQRAEVRQRWQDEEQRRVEFQQARRAIRI